MNEFCMWDKCESLGARAQAVVERVMPPPPKDVHTLNSGACEYITCQQELCR